MIYLDESGVSPDEPFLVVAGVVIHADKQWKAIEKYLHDMADDLIPPDMRAGFFFHSTELYSGGKRFKRDRWPKENRWKILEELVSIPTKFDLPIVCGIVFKEDFKVRQTRHLALSSGLTIKETLAVRAQAVALMICAISFEQWASKAAESNEVGLMIAEDNKEARTLMRNMINFNRNHELVALLPEGTRKHVPLTRIVDTVHYAEKLDSSPLQIADACAFTLMRRLRRGADCERFYKLLEPQIVNRPNFAKFDLIALPSA